MAAARTLLEMTQEILEQMQSDEVDSITDTAESTAVAGVIRRTYWDLFGPQDAPEHYSLFQLDETSASTPTLMTIPTNCMKVEWVKYNVETVSDTDDRFVYIDFVPIDSFINDMHGLVESSDTVSTFSYTFHGSSDASKIFYRSDTRPYTYTTPDDISVLFNSIDTDVDTYLTAAKTLCYGLLDPTFTFTDGFTPDLDARSFSMLFNEAKSQCFIDLKQIPNSKAEQRARQAKISVQKHRRRTPFVSELDRLPDYGRK